MSGVASNKTRVMIDEIANLATHALAAKLKGRMQPGGGYSGEVTLAAYFSRGFHQLVASDRESDNCNTICDDTVVHLNMDAAIRTAIALFDKRMSDEIVDCYYGQIRIHLALVCGSVSRITSSTERTYKLQ